MITPLFWAAAALAGLDWIGTGFSWKALRYFTKPAALLALILWFVQVGGLQGELLWFGLGLIFSLVGDVMLMLPSRFFISGLIAFLLAHVFYIFGFDLTPLPIQWGTLAVLAAVILTGFFILRSVRNGMRAKPGSEQMLIPAQIYGLVISLMLFAALLTLMRPEWPLQAAIYASVGAALFYISDSILVHNRFIKPVRSGDVLVMVTYHAAQFSIASGALIAFAG
jgi:alkenylglycerophosphocholine hydrolase